MESFFKESNTAKATEVLFFENAEIMKFKGNDISFAAAGSLSLLYFSDYSRYVLQLNDWRYPLLRRLPILGEKDEMGGRSYLLPAINGFFFRLRIEGARNEAFSNLETIFLNNSGFSMKGQESTFRKLEASPDDKLFRGAKKSNNTPIGIATEILKQVTDRTKTAVGTLKTGTRGIDSRKGMVHLKDIKNKNFKKQARSSFKKDFFATHETMSNEFLKMRRENTSLLSIKDFKELSKFTGPSLYIPREDIEEAILNNKDLAGKGSFNMSMTMPEPKKMGAMESLKQGLTDLKKDLKQEFAPRDRQQAPLSEKVTGVEGLTHFSG